MAPTKSYQKNANDVVLCKFNVGLFQNSVTCFSKTKVSGNNWDNGESKQNTVTLSYNQSNRTHNLLFWQIYKYTGTMTVLKDNLFTMHQQNFKNQYLKANYTEKYFLATNRAQQCFWVKHTHVIFISLLLYV